MRKPRSFAILVLSGLLWSAPAIPAAMAQASAPHDPPVTAPASAGGEVVVGVGHSYLVNLPSAYTDVMIAEPKIADVMPLNPRTLYVVGKTMGSTGLTIYGPGRKLILSTHVIVSADLEGLRAKIHQILPTETQVSVSAANQAIMLSGTVTSPAALTQIVKLAETYDPGKIVNLLTVQGTQQVMLSVRFVEMQRTTAKNLRLNVQQTPTTTNPSVQVTSGDSILNAAATALTSFGNASLGWAVGGGNLNLLFDALESKGVIKTLAEPTLVTMSGDTASFLAGGEFPVPVAQSGTSTTGLQAAITVEFKQFGISLAFTPTILQDGLINMVVNPEVSSIDPSSSINVGIISIPGIKVRRAHTTVELRAGESFTIAGLLSSDYQNSIRQLPFVGDIPILGTLFRSTGFKNDQTELVLVVTPHLVVPRRAQPATPTDQFVPPSDLELFLLGAQNASFANVPAEDRALLAIHPSQGGGIEGSYGHVLYKN